MLTLFILIVFFLMLASLFMGLYFLFKETKNSTHLLTSLKVRVVLALLLITLITVGLLTNSLHTNQPWHPSDQVDKNK